MIQSVGGTGANMSINSHKKERKRESLFLNEIFMAAACTVVVITSLITLFFRIREGNAFGFFEGLTKLATALAMYLAFKFFKWDVAKGLTGGVLFCLMYQEAHFTLAELWSEQNFDTYLVAGVQGSLYLAAAGMALVMTIIITINHFFISYTSQGNPKNVILNRIAIGFKFAVYILLFAANSKLGFSSVILWKNALQYLTDIALLLLVISMESQFDSFKAIRQELLRKKRERRKDR
jgi:hypothetical protein